MFRGLRRYAFALAPLSAAALWGGMYVVSEWTFASVPPLTLAFFRVAVGAAVLLPLVRIRGETLPRDQWRLAVALGAWVTVTLAAQFVGTDLTTASQGSLVTILTPVATVALGAVVLDERVTRRRTGGTVLAVLGTVVVLAGQYDPATVTAGNSLGVAALVVASVAWAAYTVYGAPLVREYSALATTAYSAAASVPMLGLLAGAELAVVGVPSLPDWRVVAAVVYLGVFATAAAWYLWYRGVEYVDAGTASVFFFVQPVVGISLGVALLDEQVGAGFLLGGAVMAAGIYVVSSEAS